jgi:hypothetical protein
MRISGISDVVEVFTCFERALEKYPDPAEKFGSKKAQQLATLVFQARTEFWKEVQLRIESIGRPNLRFKRLYSCPCCGELVNAPQMIKAPGLAGTGKKTCGSNGGS